MSIIVTTQSNTSTPFYNGAEEVKEQYMRIYGFDYKKACCLANDYELEKLDQQPLSHTPTEAYAWIAKETQ